jgi:uncharacterized protein (UPF0276 family)
MRAELPDLGFGLGLRTNHYKHIFAHRPAVGWFEIISENFMDTDGRPKRNLARILEHYPVVMHGVAMSIGTVDPLNSEYLRKLKALMAWVKPAWISDHLCWTGVAHRNTHDLLPLPYTEESLRHVVRRIKAVQDYLECPIALENPSTYLEFQHSAMDEAAFLAEMARESGCRLLLDVNNVYVTCYNHRLDPKAYLDALPMDRVIQIHLAGHDNHGTHIIDTHDRHVADPVWELYKYAISRAGRVPNTMIEWDDAIPEFPVLYAELDKARAAAAQAAQHVLPDLAQPRPAPCHAAVALAEAQLVMQRAIMDGSAFDSRPEYWILPKPGFAPQAQLDVYVNAYRARLAEVTAEDYPALRTWLGDGRFEALIADFVGSEQPVHFNIGRFARLLPGFVARRLPDDGFAAQLCELETALAQLADAPESAPLGQRHLAGLTPEILLSMRLHLRQSCRLFAFTYAVNDYFNAVMEGEDAPAVEPQASYLAVFRHDDDMWRMDLEAQEHALLAKLLAGQTIAEALSGLDGLAGQHLTEWFARWMRAGLLAAPPGANEHTGEITDVAA